MVGRRAVPPILFTGGVALVSGMAETLALTIGHVVELARDPQYTGALGAALIAADQAEEARARAGSRPRNDVLAAHRRSLNQIAGLLSPNQEQRHEGRGEDRLRWRRRAAGRDVDDSAGRSHAWSDSVDDAKLQQVLETLVA